MWRKRADRLAGVEATLDAVVTAANENADEGARQQAEILRAVETLDSKVADLAAMIQTVTAARGERDQAVALDVKAARQSAEAAFAGVQSIAAVMTANTRDSHQDEPAAPAAAPSAAKAKTTGGRA